MAGRGERDYGKLLVFVCTGNTCRSPMAEAFARALLPDGWEATSAGLHVSVGDPPAPEAVLAASEHGADISGHRVRPMTDALAFAASLLVGMTAAHAAELRRRFPFAADKVRILGEYGPKPVRDISDPFGGTIADYRQCCRSISACLAGLASCIRGRQGPLTKDL